MSFSLGTKKGKGKQVTVRIKSGCGKDLWGKGLQVLQSVVSVAIQDILCSGYFWGVLFVTLHIEFDVKISAEKMYFKAYLAPG